MDTYTFFGSSITDWIQAVAGGALFYTIYLQYKANKTQSNQLRISLIPKFTLELSECERYLFDDNFVTQDLIFRLKRNLAYNITLTVLDKGDCEFENEILFTDMSDGDLFKTTIKYHEEMQPACFKLEMIYEDSIENEYCQQFLCSMGSIIPFAPQLKKRK